LNEPKKNEHGIYDKGEAEITTIKINKTSNVDIYTLTVSNGVTWAINARTKKWGYSFGLSDHNIEKTKQIALRSAQTLINKLKEFNNDEKNKINETLNELLNENKQGELF